MDPKLAAIAPPRFANPYVNQLALDIQAACNSLGFLDDDAYYKENDCTDSIRDIIRCLRRDDDHRNLRRDVLHSRIIQTDLVPLVKYHSSDDELCSLVVRLLMNLTNPPLLVYEEELPADKVERNYYLELVTLVQASKEFFNDFKFWEVLRKKLEDVLRTDARERSEEQQLIVERILILLRNVLHIPADPAEESRTDDDASVHDQVVYALKQSDFDVILMYLASSTDERELSLHVLEIISLMMREQNPADLAVCGKDGNERARSDAARDKDEIELMAAREREVARRREAEFKYASRSLKGTYQVKNMKGVGSHDVITHKPVTGASEISFDKLKHRRRTPKNRFVAKETDPSERRRSAFPVRVFLRGFALEFLHGAYNSIMRTVKNFVTGGRAQANDESYYMWALRFFMEFNRSLKFQVDLVSETMHVDAFHYIQTQMSHYSDMMTVDKRKAPLWSKRLHVSMRAFHELLLNLVAMTASRDEVVRSVARSIKSTIFYMAEYRELLPAHLQRYTPGKFSVGYLKDLVETNHVYLKLLQDYTKVHSKIVIQRKVRRTKKKKKKDGQGKEVLTEEQKLAQKEEQWNAIAGDVRRELEEIASQSSDDFEPFVPYDVLITDEAERKADAVRRIQKALKSSDTVGEAVKLLRSARLLIPDGTFGASEGEVPVDDDVSLLKEIFLADMGEGPDESKEAGSEEEEEGEDEEEEESTIRTVEKEMEFVDFVLRYAHAKVVENYAYLLRFYDTNPPLTNHCIAKMMHRLAFDCKIPAILFQASLFRTFQKIMHDPASRAIPSLKELATFGVHLWRQFAKAAQDNPLVFVEILFLKSQRDAVEISAGYGSYKSKSTGKGVWSEEQEFELERLYNEFKNLQHSEKEIIHLITTNLIDRTKTERMVTRKLRDMGLIAAAKGSRGGGGKVIRSRVPWSEEEETELRELWETHKDAMDALARIFDAMTMKRAKKRITEKMLELGLIADKSDLKKGRKKSRRAGEEGEDEGSSNSEGSGSESSAESAAEEEAVEEEEPSGTVNAAVLAMGEDVSKRVQALMPMEGTKDVFSWLAKCLRNAAEDVAENEADPEIIPDTEGIALVPLGETPSDFVDEAILASLYDGKESSEEAGEASDEESERRKRIGINFYHLLKRLGYSPPGKGGQEAYWRLHVPPKNPRNCSTALRLRAEYLERAIIRDEFAEVPDEKFFGEGFRTAEEKQAAKVRAKVVKRLEKQKLRAERKALKKLKKKQLKDGKSSKAKSTKEGNKFKSSEFVDVDDSSSDDDVAALDRVLGRAKGVEAATHSMDDLEQLETNPSSLGDSDGRPTIGDDDDDGAMRNRSTGRIVDESSESDSSSSSSSSSSDSSSDTGSSDDDVGRKKKATIERKRNVKAFQKTKRLQYSDSEDEGDKEEEPKKKRKAPVRTKKTAGKENADPSAIPDPSGDDVFNALMKSTAEKQKMFDALHDRRTKKAQDVKKLSLEERVANASRGEVLDNIALSSSSEDEGEDVVRLSSTSARSEKRSRVLSDSDEDMVVGNKSGETEASRGKASETTDAVASDSGSSVSASPAAKKRRVTIQSDGSDDDDENVSKIAPGGAESSDDEITLTSKKRSRVRVIADSDSE